MRKENKMNQTIWYFSQELEFRTEVESRDEAQALLDYERRQGRTACATHYDGKHQIYGQSKEERG